jgi:hypothetical protein
MQTLLHKELLTRIHRTFNNCILEDNNCYKRIFLMFLCEKQSYSLGRISYGAVCICRGFSIAGIVNTSSNEIQSLSEGFHFCDNNSRFIFPDINFADNNFQILF